MRRRDRPGALFCLSLEQMLKNLCMAGGFSLFWGFIFCIFLYIIHLYSVRSLPNPEVAVMTRTNAREIAVHFIFELGFSNESAQSLLEEFLTPEAFARLGEEEPLYAQFPNDKQRAYIEELVSGVYQHAAELDSYIERYAQGWRFARIDRVAVAIMRSSMYEILYMPDIPNSASINEAVEIAKGYETPETCSFINGILGTFVREELPEVPEK